jgi:putative membrane protein
MVCGLAIENGVRRFNAQASGVLGLSNVPSALGAHVRFFALLVLSFLLTASAPASAQAPSLSRQDTQLIQDAAMTGSFEIQASQMALQNAAQESVKEFARHMLLEYELISSRLASLASAKHVELPTDLDSDRRDELDKLQQLKGADFDKRYIEEVAVGAPEQALERFNAAYKATSDKEVRAFAAETMKRMQQHLARANNIAGNADRDGEAPKRSGTGQRLPAGEAAPRGGEPTREGAPGTPENAAESQ